MSDVRKKVAMIVYNSVSHDARVLKEAGSLQKSGFDVCIFGIQDNKRKEPFEKLINGVDIRRVEWKSTLYRYMAAIIAASSLLLAFLLSISTLYLFDLFSQFATREVFAYTMFFGVFFIGVTYVLKFLKISRNYSRIAIKHNLNQRHYPTGALQISQITDLIKRFLAIYAMQKAVLGPIKEYDPIVVHSHDLVALPAGAQLKKDLGIKLVYDSHEIYEEQGINNALKRQVYIWMQRRYSRHVDAFITINESIADFLRGRYSALPPATIIMNATLPKNFVVDYDGRLHAAAELPRDKKILLYQGGFSRKRGLEFLVRAAPNLKDDWCLVMMGWGALENVLRKIANDVDPDGSKIKFISPAPHDELVYWTAGATVGMIPYEGGSMNHLYCTPNKLWEYPNAGVPLVVSPFPEMRKIVETYRVGWLLGESLSAEDIAETVNGIDEGSHRKAVEACNRFIADNNWVIYEKRLVELYGEYL